MSGECSMHEEIKKGHTYLLTVTEHYKF